MNGNPFTASNGWTVEADGNSIGLQKPDNPATLVLGPDLIQTLAEYTLAQHGLWLAPNGLVCIRQPEPNLVGVIFPGGDITFMTRAGRKATWETRSDEELRAAESAADAYFDAHPEPPKQCDAALEVEGVLLRCDKEGAHSVHEGSGKTSQGRSFTAVWETP